MKRAITMALVTLLWALPAAAAFNTTDEVQAPRGQEIQAPRGQAGAPPEIQAPRGQDIQAPRTVDHALLRAEELQAPVRSDEIQAPRTVETA